MELREVDRYNWTQCIKLKPKEDQVDFIATNVFSIAECKIMPNLKPMAIYAGGTLVGFTLFDTEPHSEDGCHWILRLMIDGEFQGKGYGKAALDQILQQMKELHNVKAIRISTVPDNVLAKALYLKMGFENTGLMDGEEMILEMRIATGLSNIDKRGRLDEEVFTYRMTKNNKVFIDWKGRTVTTLSGKEADKFISRIQNAGAKDAQIIMAKATGHFKH